MPARPSANAVTGYSISIRQGNDRFVSTVSSLGASSIQMQPPAAGGAPIATRGALVDYGAGRLYALDFVKQAYRLVSIEDSIRRLKGEISVTRGALTIPGLGKKHKSFPLTIAKIRQPVTVSGIQAHVYVVTDSGRKWRLYYADSLPKPPTAMMRELAALMPAAPTAGDLSQFTAMTPMLGLVLLRADVQTGKVLKSVMVAESVRKIQVDPSSFIPPAGWLDLDSPAVSRPILVTKPWDVGSFSGLSAPTTALVQWHGGPVSTSPQLHLLFWGKTFTDPNHSQAITMIFTAFNLGIFQPGYHNWLEQYGVDIGFVRDSSSDSNNPDNYVGGGAGFVPIAAHVIEQGLDGKGPLFWFVWGDNPLYGVFLPAAVVANGNDYHFMAPNGSYLWAPWPFTLLVHEGMPFFVVHTPEAAMSMPTDSVPSAGTAGAFDVMTEGMSHEYVETVTDPFPFLGWSDWGKMPLQDNSEIGDICENADPWGRTTRNNNFALSTYWSQKDQACVPPSLPTIAITAPSSGTIVQWVSNQGVPGGAVNVAASSHDPFDGNNVGISWRLDGGSSVVATGPTPRVSGIPLGTHTITATVKDSQLKSASAGISVTVVAKAPTATITSPTAGANIPVDQLVVFRGSGLDLQDGPLPDAALTWTVNGVNVGTGSLFTKKINSLGAATIMLTVKDIAGLVGTATVSIKMVPALGVPSVVITAPANKQSFAGNGEMISFTATGQDSNGQSIPNTSFRWTDDVDGAMGTGSTIKFALTGGPNVVINHTVTVTVTDSSGHTKTDHVLVFVGTVGLPRRR